MTEHRPWRAQHIGVIDVCEVPARIACTSVNTLRPGLAPPTRPVSFMVSLIKRLQLELTGERRRQDQPSIGGQIVVVEDVLDPIQRLRYLRH